MRQLLLASICFALLQLSMPASAQDELGDAGKWAKEISRKGKAGNVSGEKLQTALEKYDSTQTFKFLDELFSKGEQSDYHFKGRFNCIKAYHIFLRNVYLKDFKAEKSPLKPLVKTLLQEAMDAAYRSEDDYLVMYVSRDYGRTIMQFGELGLAVMYAIKSVDLQEKYNMDIAPEDYQFIAEMFYKVKEYENSIRYARKAAVAWQHSPLEIKRFTVSCINTIGLDYNKLAHYDSAFYYYDSALSMARRMNDKVWVGIVSGNMAQIYYAQQKYDTAYKMFIHDYTESKDSGYFDNAGNSLQWAARTDLALGNKAKALDEVREAYVLLRKWNDYGYLRNAYQTSMLIFREMKNYDSAFYYYNLYVSLNDSLERSVNVSSIDISKAKLNDEASRYNILRLNREKRAQLQLRNFIIAFIILVAIILLLYINRLRSRQRYRSQLDQQEKNNAREQLQLITQNLSDKTSLVEQLQRQLDNRSVSAERQELANTISNLTILTESDWEKFKNLFEQLYPGFFLNLQEKAPGITVAELRMAALTRLRLSTNQIASILGISANSVYKTKQRLRQRLNLEGDDSIEETIQGV